MKIPTRPGPLARLERWYERNHWQALAIAAVIVALANLIAE